MPRGKWLLFASYHSYIDPSSGAAISVRELLRQLAARGWEIRTCCGPLLDFDRAENIRQSVADERIVFRESNGAIGERRFSWLTFRDGGIQSSVFVPEGASDAVPSPENGSVFCGGFMQSVDRWKPDLLLTYGGNWTAGTLLREARQRGIPSVFWLHNLAYRDACLFELVDRIIVPSPFAADHYRESIGIDSVILPCLIDWRRVTCQPSGDRCYVTFVNPQPAKGVFWFARIAEQLHRRRPEIHLLIVEGRSGVGWLERCGLDLSALRNVHAMETTPDPRDFYRVSRSILVPSLCRETFGRVAAEAMVNGIPVLASNRGALPEVVGDAGFLFDVPGGYTPESREVPTAEEVAPWVDTIIRLWDGEEFYVDASRRCRERAEAWRPDVLLPRYEEVFGQLAAVSRNPTAP